MDTSTGRQVVIKAAVTASVLATAALMHRRHPKLAKATLWIVNGAMIGVVANNYRIAHR